MLDLLFKLSQIYFFLPSSLFFIFTFPLYQVVSPSILPTSTLTSMVKNLHHCFFIIFSDTWRSPLDQLSFINSILIVRLEEAHMESWMNFHPFRQFQSISNITNPFYHLKRTIIPLHKAFVVPFCQSPSSISEV